MDFSVRIATVDDAELIADVSRETFYESYAAYNTTANMEKFMNEQFTKGRLMLEVGKPENIFLLAYNDDTVAGYLKLKDGAKPSALRSLDALEIARIYANKNFVRKGIGKLLMQQAIDIAIAKGKEIIWLIVWQQNQRAIDFYKQWGFEIFGECDFLLGNDVQKDWMMKKVLT